MTQSGQRQLLDAASSILSRAGFVSRIEPLGEDGPVWLLAEDSLFAIAVLAGDSLAELKEVESLASEALLDRLGGIASGAKRWDVYLVFITPQRWASLDDRERVEFEYNTRGIRRLVGAQVIPGDEGDIEEPILGVLRPFLPLSDPIGSALADLDGALADALVVNGVDQGRAVQYVAAFRARGDLEDV
jgi:hypothetical protein